MIQTLDIPVVSLAVPNIHKLKAITSDDLSCMWTVFSKCKDNLENGRRLENLSWRLWYRESLIERNIEPTPIPIQTCPVDSAAGQVDSFSYGSTDSENQSPQTPTGLKHVSPSSFKRIISSFADTPPLITPKRTQEPLKPKTWAEHTTKFYVSDDDEDSGEDVSDSDTDNEDENGERPHQQQQPILETLFDEDHSVHINGDDDGQWSTVRSDHFERAFSNEFEKQTPRPAARPSILTTMLRNKTAPIQRKSAPTTHTSMHSHQATRPLVREKRRPRVAVHANGECLARTRLLSTRPTPPEAELSKSLQFCVDWEHRQNVSAVLPIPKTPKDTSTACNWESFHGW